MVTALVLGAAALVVGALALAGVWRGGDNEATAGYARDAKGRPPVVVDLCSGSGAIARSVVDEVPGAQVHAVELDPDAFTWALTNLSGTGVDLREGAQVFARRLHVLVLGRALRPRLGRTMELVTVADAQTIIH